MILDRLDLETLRSLLKTKRLGKVPGWTNEVWDSIESTNTRAAELAEQGAPDGVIVLARQQTAGRGRQGRAWISPADAGVYVSFLLRPQGELSSLPAYTLAAGVACVRAIGECVGIELGLKWVNDLIYEGRKTGGILAEVPGGSTHTPDSRALIIGIGINLRLEASSLPDDLRDKIDWLERASGQPINPNILVAALAEQLEDVCSQLAQNNSKQILNDWKKHSVTLGREIRTVISGRALEGKAVDIDADGALVVQTDDHQLVRLSGGEISIRGPHGSYI